MSWIRGLAILAAVTAFASGVIAIFYVGHTPPPTTPTDVWQPEEDGSPREPEEYVEPFPDVDLSAESLDSVRRAELSRRARRPDGDPKRKYALNYEGVLTGPKPKPAEAKPATACRSVEPLAKGIDPLSGPHRLHDLTVSWFETSSGFGFVRMLAFKNKRGVHLPSQDIDRVELVSLLTDLQPSVFVLDEMATPPLTRKATRRPLDEFETRGLEAVRGGEELVWTREAPKRMFGAIRASKSCLDCHSAAKEGDLLGAFTYYLDVPADQLQR
jgi:hypothetical protein